METQDATMLPREQEAAGAKVNSSAITRVSKTHNLALL